MMMAQRSGEAGYITYMRTDSTNLSQDVVNMVRGYWRYFGKKYLPDNPEPAAKKPQERTVDPSFRRCCHGGVAKDMEADAQKLYQLIWRQFVARQMTPAQYDSLRLPLAQANSV